MIKREDDELIFEAGSTRSEPTVEDAVSDKNVRLQLHKIGSRVIRYVIKHRKSKGLPRVVEGSFYTSLHYGALKRAGAERKKLEVLYYDNTIRLLAFGENRERDYLFVVRR